MHKVSFILLIIGGLNWGLAGLGSLAGGSDWNVVHLILGSLGPIEAIVYVLVGLAAISEVVSHKKLCRNCNVGGAM